MYAFRTGVNSSSPRYGSSEDMYHPRYRTATSEHDSLFNTMDLSLELADQNDDSMHIYPSAIADDNLVFNPVLPS